MVVVLPDSSLDLWRLCHNLGGVSGVVSTKPLHLVAAQETLYKSYYRTNLIT